MLFDPETIIFRPKLNFDKAIRHEWKSRTKLTANMIDLPFKYLKSIKPYNYKKYSSDVFRDQNLIGIVLEMNNIGKNNGPKIDIESI